MSKTKAASIGSGNVAVGPQACGKSQEAAA